jgi:hypothetical protein
MEIIIAPYSLTVYVKVILPSPCKLFKASKAVAFPSVDCIFITTMVSLFSIKKTFVSPLCEQAGNEKNKLNRSNAVAIITLLLRFIKHLKKIKFRFPFFWRAELHQRKKTVKHGCQRAFRIPSKIRFSKTQGRSPDLQRPWYNGKKRRFSHFNAYLPLSFPLFQQCKEANVLTVAGAVEQFVFFAISLFPFQSFPQKRYLSFVFSLDLLYYRKHKKSNKKTVENKRKYIRK